MEKGKKSKMRRDGTKNIHNRKEKKRMKFESWEPGNMTRYVLAVTGKHEKDGQVMVLWNKQPAVEGIILRSNIADVRYVSEKTGWNLADTAAILAWVETKTGVKAMMPTGFNQKGLWEGIDS